MPNESLFSGDSGLAKGSGGEYNGQEPMNIPSHIERLAVMYPSGNLTAVVFDPILDVPRQELNDKIMDEWKAQHADKPEIEQCCFVTAPHDERATARVEMFGGEFCGNATRSVIQLISNGEDQEGLIEVSGTDKLLSYSVDSGNITVDMPLPEDAGLVERTEEGSLVRLDGITHLVMVDEDARSSQSCHDRLKTIVENDKYGAKRLPAFGVTYYDPDSAEADFAVWVNEVNSFFDETACGSGTCAIGVAMALAAKEGIELEVVQPSGETIVTRAQTDQEGNITASSISGKVTSLFDGEFDLTRTN